jgi:hypothetical protein
MFFGIAIRSTIFGMKFSLKECYKIIVNYFKIGVKSKSVFSITQVKVWSVLSILF